MTFNDIYSKRDEINRTFESCVDFDLQKRIYNDIVNNRRDIDLENCISFKIDVYLDYKFSLTRAEDLIFVLKAAYLDCKLYRQFDIINIINKINKKIDKHKMYIQSTLNKQVPSDLAKHIIDYM